MLGKVYIVLDFDNDQQKEQVQQLLKEVSNLRLTNGGQIISVYPFIKAHQNEIMQLFNMIKTNGVKSLLSVQGGILLNKLMRK